MQKTLAIVAASPLTVNFFLQEHVQALSHEYQVSIVVNADGPEELGELAKIAEFVPMRICREVSLLDDLAALWGLYRLFRCKRFDLIHSISPKAGLLCMIAAWMAGAKNRLHTFTGQVWVTKVGFNRWLLKLMDKIIAKLATTTLVDSYSQKDFLVEQGVVSEANAKVLAAGSISGVNFARFYPDIKQRCKVRQELGVAEFTNVILYLGRLKKDKGVLDLAYAFLKVTHQISDVVLLVVGPDEEKLLPKIIKILGDSSDSLRYVPYTREPEYFLRAADILCLPSYREGFGSVVIEAAACGIPSVVTKIYGLSDAVVENETGLLVPTANVPELANAITKLLTDCELRAKQGSAARKRAVSLFSQERVTQEWLRLYARLFAEQDAM